jgi:hypothetical protein
LINRNIGGEKMQLNKPKVLIVGTFHMKATPDLYKAEIDNLLSEKRQSELEHVVNSIKRFNPTKVAVEVVKENNDKLNEDYSNFINENVELEVDEVHQLGFRIAAQLSHKEIYAIDWMDWNNENKSFGEILEWAKENQPILYKDINEKYLTKFSSFSNLGEKSIGDFFKEINNTDLIDRLHEAYLAVARIAKGTDYVGIDWVSWWYQRNLIIYSNVAAITETTDRTLLIIGASHVHLVAQFLRESGQFEVVETSEYI